ncbi:hypothetical protein [Actinomadura kijaniata]|uniref:hypothetical protein n=1 Tax=Actinomadura kijaniata TaxID=46161 RepID=UPI0008338A4A|nr:hypothetical protein [Actinomadura kijaniata]
MTPLRAIDPVGCGCTECLTGEYRPLDRATADEIVALLTGKLANNLHSGTTLALTVTTEVTSPYQRPGSAPAATTVTAVTVRCEQLRRDLPAWCLPLLPTTI